MEGPSDVRNVFLPISTKKFPHLVKLGASGSPTSHKDIRNAWKEGFLEGFLPVLNPRSGWQSSLPVAQQGTCCAHAVSSQGR